MPDIPLELKSRVLSYVESRADLREIAVVDRGWQRAAESKIWERFDYDPSCRRDNCVDCHCLTISAGAQRVEHRLAAIRSLIVRPRTRHAVQGYIDILTKVGDQLHHLVVAPSENSTNRMPPPSAYRSLAAFYALLPRDCTFHSLRWLNLRLTQDDWANDLITVLVMATGIESFTLSTAARDPQDLAMDFAIPPLPRLTRLRCVLDKITSSLLDPILSGTTNMVFLDLEWFESDGAQPSSRQVPRVVTCKAPAVEHLQIRPAFWFHSDLLTFSFKDGRFPSLRVCRVAKLSPDELLDFDILQIFSNHPTLEKILLVVDGIADRYFDPYYYHFSLRYAMDLVGAILSLPSLLYLMVDAGIPTSPLRSDDKPVDGGMIRTYSNGVQTLVHFRHVAFGVLRDSYRGPRLSRYQDRFLEEAQLCPSDEWGDYAAVQNKRISPSDLRRVYEMIDGSGEGMRWSEPKRGLSLPDEAWRFLAEADEYYGEP